MKHATILAALAVLTILSAPAEARSPKTSAVAPKVDVAAIPPYPMAGQNKTPTARGRAVPHRRSASRTAADSPPLPKPSPRAAAPQPAGSGVVMSHKTGATARVSPRFAPIAQAVVDDLEQNYGAAIKFMGGFRKGPCWAGGLHPCGLAIDLCQTARGIVDRRCNLPSRAVEAQVAAAHGALSGGIWCNQDRGHVQLGNTAGPCGHNLYAAVTEFQAKRGHARHSRVRFARR